MTTFELFDCFNKYQFSTQRFLLKIEKLIQFSSLKSNFKSTFLVRSRPFYHCVYEISTKVAVFLLEHSLHSVWSKKNFNLKRNELKQKYKYITKYLKKNSSIKIKTLNLFKKSSHNVI